MLLLSFSLLSVKFAKTHSRIRKRRKKAICFILFIYLLAFTWMLFSMVNLNVVMANFSNSEQTVSRPLYDNWATIVGNITLPEIFTPAYFWQRVRICKVSQQWRGSGGNWNFPVTPTSNTYKFFLCLCHAWLAVRLPGRSSQVSQPFWEATLLSFHSFTVPFPCLYPQNLITGSAWAS